MTQQGEIKEMHTLLEGFYNDLEVEKEEAIDYMENLFYNAACYKAQQCVIIHEKILTLTAEIKRLET